MAALQDRPGGARLCPERSRGALEAAAMGWSSIAWLPNRTTNSLAGMELASYSNIHFSQPINRPVLNMGTTSELHTHPPARQATVVTRGKPLCRMTPPIQWQVGNQSSSTST